MLTRTGYIALFFLIAVNIAFSQEAQRLDKSAILKNHPELQKLLYSQQPKELSAEAKHSLEVRGYKVLGLAPKLVSPSKDSLATNNEITRIAVSVDLSASGIKPIWMGTPHSSVSSAGANDTIMKEDFEGSFPGTKWQRTGDPTWGKTNYDKHSGSYSAWCAKDSTKGVQPGQSYPKNCKSMMIYGPFDLSNVNYAQLRFWYRLDLDTSKGGDWFSFLASADGNNFQGIGVSGATNGWEEEMLHLHNVPGLGNVTGRSQVWIAFRFESNDTTTSDIGVFVDDISLTKRQISGTILAGYITGELKPAGNPYIAVGNIGVAKGDSLTIDPGVIIRFDSGIGFIVRGLLEVVGSNSDSVHFTSNTTNPSPGDWSGIGFYNGDSNCLMQYCIVEYSGYNSEAGVYTNIPKMLITNCLIWRNKATGITCNNTLIIKQNTIKQNDKGIDGTLAGSALITDNYITNNNIGVYAFLCNFILRNNTISYNKSEGIISSTSELRVIHNIINNNGSDGVQAAGAYQNITTGITVINNTVLDNAGCGIGLSELAYYGNVAQNCVKGNQEGGINIFPTMFVPQIRLWNNTVLNNGGVGINFSDVNMAGSFIMNNIVVGHSIAGLKIDQLFPKYYVKYNDFYNNKNNIECTTSNPLGLLTSKNIRGDSCDIYNNIFLDPLLKNANNNDFSLLSNSPCLNAGVPSVFLNNADGKNNDMGAFGGTALYVHPIDYDFGDVVVGAKRDITLDIANFRETEINIAKIILTDSTNYGLIATVPLRLSAYTAGNITISCKPKSQGFVLSTLKINSTDFIGSNEAKLELKGRGIKGTAIQNLTASEVWTLVNSPYLLNGAVEVPQNGRLVIEPGVQVLFESGSLTIKGYLSAVGSTNLPIIFRSSSSDAVWNGLNFYMADSTSILENCRVVQSDLQGIRCEQSNITINKCIIENNLGNYDFFGAYGGGGITVVASSPKIINNIIRNNKTNKAGGGIAVHNKSVPIIKNNIIAGNWANEWGGIYTSGYGGGIAVGNLVDTLQRPNIQNNIIMNNVASLGGGIGLAWLAQADIVNNTIVRNGSYGVAEVNMSNCGTTIIRNTIIQQNYFPYNSPIDLSGSARIMIFYSNIQNGWQGIGNIKSDPCFVDTVLSDYHLKTNSPCIDSGDPNPKYNDPQDPKRPGYALFPALGTVRNDMGAYGGSGAANWDVINAVELYPEGQIGLTKGFALYQNYPNPFSQQTAISFKLLAFSHVRLEIFDLLDRKVATLVDEEKDAGEYITNFTPRTSNIGIHSGIYLCRLTIGKNTQTRKMIVMLSN